MLVEFFFQLAGIFLILFGMRGGVKGLTLRRALTVLVGAILIVLFTLVKILIGILVAFAFLAVLGLIVFVLLFGGRDDKKPTVVNQSER